MSPPPPAGFHPGRSTLDQTLYLFQSILDEFNQPKPGYWTILATIDFFKAFNSNWHPTLFQKLISADFIPCFARWTQSFLSDRHVCVVFQNHKSCSFRVHRDVSQDPFLALYFSLFSSMIFLLLSLLPLATLFMLTTLPFGLPPLGPCYGKD